MAYEPSATKDSKKTTTKKTIPDDPYFDSSSPAGSNFKRTTSTSSSNGFQNSSSRSSAPADPYFSNTSPAGSTMSSDKSTWRNTNSGWNVPPSGGTAAQGGGRVSTRQIPDDPYYDSGRPAGSGFESQRESSQGRSRSSSTVEPRQQWEGPMPTRDRGSEFVSTRQEGPLVRMTNDIGTQTWSPSTVRNSGENLPFTSPLWNWAASTAERGRSYLEQVQENYDDSGIKRSHDERAAEREEWYNEQVDRGGWRAAGATIGSIFAAAAQAGEMTADFSLARPMPDSPWTMADTYFAEAEGDKTYQPPTPITVGQFMSAAGQGVNRKFNILSSDYEGPLPMSQAAANPQAGRDEWTGSWWNIFSNSIEDSQRVNEQFASLSPTERYMASPVFNMLHSSGPKAQEQALTTVLTQTETVAQLRKQAEAAQASGDMLGAASFNMAAENLAAKSSLDIVEENKNWAGDLVAKLIVPDAFDFFVGPAVNAGVANAQKVKAMLASPLTEASVEEATRLLQGAISGAEDLARLADSGGDLFRFWKGKKNAIVTLFENTKVTEAERVAANMSDTLAVVLPRARTADEAKVLITEMLDGTLFAKRPDIGRNPFLDPQFLEDLPVIKQAQDLILNAKTLNDPEGYNPLLVLGELEDLVWRKSRQLFGLDDASLPTGTVRTKAVKQGDKYVVQWLGADDTVLKTGDEMPYKQAKKLADEQAQLVKEGLSKPWYMRVGDWQRAVLSTMYLNLAPRHWIRNAVAAYSAMTVDDALNITKLDNIADHVTRLYGGGAPSAEFGDVFRGLQVNPTAPETATNGLWTFGGRWTKNNPIAWLDNAGSRIWTGTTELPIGGGNALPIGEEAFRIRIAYQRMMQYLNHGVDALSEDLAAGLRDLGVAPELASSYVGRFSDLARSTDRTAIFDAMREAIGAPELAGTLDEIGITATQTTPQGRASLMRILNSASADDLGSLQGELFRWLKEETSGLSEILSQVQPQPGRAFFTSIDMAQDAAEGIETLTYAATKGGMDPAEARLAAETLWRGVIDNEKQALQAVQDLIANTTGTDAFDRAFLFFRKLEDEKRTIRMTVDRLNRNASRMAREGQNVWAETQNQVSKLWSDYAGNVQTWLDDVSNATVAPRVQAVAQPFAVGDTVRLSDGTEATVKQVLQENDITSYVVTPRAQQAAALAPVQAAQETVSEQGRVLSLSADDFSNSVDINPGDAVVTKDGRNVKILDIEEYDDGGDAPTGIFMFFAEEVAPPRAAVPIERTINAADIVTPQRVEQAAPQPPIVEYRRIASEIEASLPPVQEGYTRLWRGNRPGEVGQNPQFTNDLAGIALPFQKSYGGELSYVDVNTINLAQFEQTAGAAPGAEFVLPQSVAKSAKTVAIPQAAPAPTFAERTINAVDIVTPQRVEQAAQATTDDILKKYLEFDEAENARLREMGVSPSSDDITWSRVIDAGRDYVDQALRDSLLFFRRAPSQDFFDHLVSAEKDINETGMWVAAQVARIRDNYISGAMDKAEYLNRTGELWNQFWEFGHQRYRFATNAGVRASLGDDAADALGSISTYHVPPTPTLDDVRRMASLAGRATDRGDKRLVNSINKHLNMGLAKLDDMTPDQRRAAFQYYINEAQAANVDIPAEWYRWRNPNMSAVTGFEEGGNFAETMWRLESGRMATGNTQTPTYGDVARSELANAWDVVQKVMDNAERLLAPRPNNLTNQQKSGAIRLLNTLLRKQEDILYNAAKAGEEATAFAMLNYRDRKNIDTFLSAIFPYHYYFTRAPMNWLRRTIERPSIAYNVWLANRAIQGENEQFAGPTRTTGTVPNPIRNLMGNLGATSLAENMPSRVYSPIEYAIPYSIWNDFIRPEEGQGRFERAWMNLQRYTPGFQPLIQVGASTLFDAFNPRKEEQWSRMSQFEVGDYVPLARMAGYLAQGISGNQIWRQLGDVFDYGRVGRVIDNGIAAGEYDPYYGNLAKGQIENQMRGYAPIPEMQEEPARTELAKIAADSTSKAGWERFGNLAMGYFFGIAGQNVEDIEREVAAFQKEYYGLGYGYDNTMGSKAALDEFKEQPLSSGVAYGDVTPRNYSSLYSPVGSEWGPLSEQAVTRKFNEERAAIYEEMGKATIDFLLENPLATGGEMSEFKQQYYDKVSALSEKYPSAAETGDGRFRVSGFGMNPYERAQAEIENVMRYDPPGKPEYPGDNATPQQVDNYYAALGEWGEKRLNVIERVFEQWAQGDDTQPGAADADYVGQRTVLGRYAQELVDAYELRFASPVEIEWHMNKQLRDEVTGPAYEARRRNLTEQFGDDGYAMFQEFQAIPEGEGNNYWTDAHDEFIEKNPEVQEMLIFDRSPEAHSTMLRMGGERVFEALAMYPGGGTKSEKNTWKAKYGREKEGVYWYFGANDNFRSSVSAAYDQADALPHWTEYQGDRPIGSGREPIGGISRQEYMQAADPYFQNDYTGMRPQDAVAAGQRDAASVSAPFGNDYNQYLATVYPSLAETMPQGSPQYALRRPGLTSPPVGSASELMAARTAADAGRLMEYLDARQQAEAEREPQARGGGSGGGGYSGYSYRGRYYRRRGGGRRRRRSSRGYRRYSRGGRGGGGRRRSYGGGGYGGGGGQVEEGQPLYLDFNGTPQVFARDFASWLYPQQQQQAWRPTGINSGFSPPRNDVPIRPWRRINVRA